MRYKCAGNSNNVTLKKQLDELLKRYEGVGPEEARKLLEQKREAGRVGNSVTKRRGSAAVQDASRFTKSRTAYAEYVMG